MTENTELKPVRIEGGMDHLPDRVSGDHKTIPDTSAIDATYVYPGDPAPEGYKWVLMKDDSPGEIAYVEARND